RQASAAVTGGVRVSCETPSPGGVRVSCETPSPGWSAAASPTWFADPSTVPLDRVAHPVIVRAPRATTVIRASTPPETLARMGPVSMRFAGPTATRCSNHRRQRQIDVRLALAGVAAQPAEVPIRKRAQGDDVVGPA